MKRAPVLALLISLLSAPASGQWSGGVQLGTMLDDNAFNNYLQVKDRLTEVSLQGAHDWETERGNLQLFYSGTLDYFSLLPSRTYQTHSAGGAYSQLFGDDDPTLLNAGGTFTLRDNHDEFSIYDHSQVSLYGNIHCPLSDLLRIRGGYAFRSVIFNELQDLDYLEHAFFIQSSISLLTRTTVILQTDLGFKTYTTPTAEDTQGSGSQRGRRWGETATSTPGVTQLTGTVRIGQGITEETGISLTGKYQLSLVKESRYLTFEDGILTDDEIFDDHYGYEGPLASLMVTQLLPAGLRLRATGSIQERHYSDRPAFDLLGVQIASQRIDTQSILSLSFDKAFPSLGLQASLVYDHIINASNDPFYSYRNHALSLWLTVTH